MSSRALRKLREERDQYQAKLSFQGNEEGDLDKNKKRIDEITDSDEDEDDNDDDESNNPRKNAFAMMMDSSSEDDDSEDEMDDNEENEDDNDEDSEDGDCEKEGDARQQQSQIIANKKEMMNKLEANKKANQIKESFQEEDEDLDAILAEFTNEELPPHIDNNERLKNEDEFDHDFLSSSYILSRIDIRALDFEASMRHNLMGTTASMTTAMTTDRIPKNSFLFGPARDGWVRPPHFVGGGMGMTSYDQSPRPIPWPYNSETSNIQQKQQQIRHATHNAQWFVFTHSDSYQQSLSSLEQIRSTGDVNALALLVADFPFLPEAILQLAKVVYQTNQSVDALSLLRRALWIYECASLKSFKDVFTLAAVSSRSTNRAIHGAYLDYSQSENSTYFQCLILLLKVSSIAG
jgi:Transcriptional repressor TCF25